MSLTRRAAPARRITLVPMIDVLFILLVYFMVTSVYRDLDMIPVVEKGAAAPAPAQGAERRGAENAAATLLLRIDGTGRVVLRGSVVPPDDLAALLSVPGRRVLILPSGAAPLRALIEVMDALAAAGIGDARLVRLEESGG